MPFSSQDVYYFGNSLLKDASLVATVCSGSCRTGSTQPGVYGLSCATSRGPPNASVAVISRVEISTPHGNFRICFAKLVESVVQLGWTSVKMPTRGRKGDEGRGRKGEGDGKGTQLINPSFPVLAFLVLAECG